MNPPAYKSISISSYINRSANMTSEDSPDSSQHWQPLRLPSGLAPADLLAQVSQRLSVLDAVERTIAKERSELWIAWNCALPVNRLPDEILVSIFAHFADAISARDARLNPAWCYPNRKWTKVIKVCRHWRDVAYASPVLWRAIVMRSTAYARRALALSTPATIDAFVVICRPILKNLKLLQPHVRRLRSLCFEGIGKSWKSTAIALLQDHGGMPALETLELPLGSRGAQEPLLEDGFTDIHLTPERFPCLRLLTVALVVAPQDIQVYARLRKLSLNTCRCDFSFEHFLDALAASTKLESLELVSILQRIQGNWVGRVVPSKSPLSLRHLKSLALVDHPPIYTSRFLSHVLLSPTASVRIDGYLGVVAEENVTETVSALLPPNPAAIMPALALVTDVSVNVYDIEYSLVGYVGPRLPASSCVTLLISSSSFSFWSGMLSHHGARDLLSVFGTARLTTLSFEGDCSNVPTEIWAETFNRYPLLETLHLGIVGTTETAFAGLVDAAPAPGSSVPCPGLRSVEVSGPFSMEALQVTLQCLRDRADKGHRLARITMELYGDEAESALFEADYIPRLRELVTEVYFSCEE